MSEYIVGVDLGTTSVKAAVLQPGGRALASSEQSYATQRPSPNHAEQDPDVWVSLVRQALENIAAHVPPSDIAAACMCSQVNTHVFVDKAGTPLLPAMVWQDTRAAQEAAELNASLSDEEKTAALSAPIPIDASHVLARMLWVCRHKPEIWDKTAYVLLPKDYVQLQLTGHVGSDPLSNVGMVGPDGTYADALLSLVPGARDRMAPLKEMTEVVGALPSPLTSVPLINGTMDGWTGLIGGGAVSDERSVYLSGTSEILGITSPTMTQESGIIVFPEAQTLRVHAGPTQSGGASAAWFCSAFRMDHDTMSKLVARSNRAPNTPMFLPQLAGERAPLWNANLRGAFLGITASTQTADLARAVFEGVAFSAKHVQDGLEASSGVVPSTLLCGGGGFRSDVWGQIRSDIFGKTLKRLAFNEPGIVGAVALAASANHANLADAHAAYASYDRTWDPDPRSTDRFAALFSVYKDAISSLAGIQSRLSAV